MGQHGIYETLPFKRAPEEGPYGKRLGRRLVALWCAAVAVASVAAASVPLRALWSAGGFATTSPVALSGAVGGAAVAAALAWFVAMALLHVHVDRAWRGGLCARRDAGWGLDAHLESARAAIERWGAELKEALPTETTLKGAFVETDAVAGRAGAAVAGLATLTALAGLPWLFLLAWLEGWSGLALAKALFLLALGAFAVSGHVPGLAALPVVAVTVAWGLLPAWVPGEAGRWSAVDGLIVVPVGWLATVLGRRMNRRAWTRFLLVTPTKLAVGIVREGQAAQCYRLDDAKPVQVSDQVESYRLELPLRSGGQLQFHLRSRAELDHLQAMGPPSCEGLALRIRTPWAWRGLDGSFLVGLAVLGAATAFAALLAAGAARVEVACLNVREGLVDEARWPASTLVWLNPFSAAARLGRAAVAVGDERFAVAATELRAAQYWAGGRGLACRVARAWLRNGFVRFCEGAQEAVELAATAEGPADLPPEAVRDYDLARRYLALADDLRPREPPGTLILGLAVARLRLAVLAARRPYPEATVLLASALGRHATRHRLSLRLAPETLRAWDDEARSLMAGVERGDRGPMPKRELLAARARRLFADERFDEAVESLKALGSNASAADRLLLASASRYTDTSLPFHLKQVRTVASDVANLEFEARLLEALLLAQAGSADDALKSLHRLGGKDERGFLARFLFVLVGDWAAKNGPTTEELEEKLQEAFSHPWLEVQDLPWPEWMSAADLDYLMALRGARGGGYSTGTAREPGSRELFGRLAKLKRYPFAARAAAHLRKLNARALEVP